MSIETSINQRDRLLDYGVAYLTEKGYHGSGLKGLLESAGIPKGSFYYYFESKDAFSAAVVTHYIQPFLDRLQTLMRNPELSGKDILHTYFSDLITSARERAFTGGCLLGNLIGELGHDSELLCRSALKIAMTSYQDAMAQVIGQGQRDGSIRSDLDPKDMAQLVINQWQGALLQAKLEHSADPLRQCIDALIDRYFARDPIQR
jgi:TetR/AcrR family transcriptional repressor of nem operon